MPRSLVVLLLLLSSLGLAIACRDRDEHGGQKKIALHPPTGTPKRPQGTPALPVNPGAPQPFSKQDVVTYFQTHNLPMNSASVALLHVDTLEFLTSKQVSERLQGESTGLSDNERVGFAALSGTFIFTGPPTTAKRKPATFNRAYAVFDAATGNLLMAGTLQQSDQPAR